MHSSQKFFSRFWSLWQKDRKSCKILSMNAISPVAPVLDVIFHFREIMKFHDHKNPVSEWSYVGLLWLRFLEVLELLWEWWESPSSVKDAVSGSQTLRLLRRRTEARSKPALDCLDFMPWKAEKIYKYIPNWNVKHSLCYHEIIFHEKVTWMPVCNCNWVGINKNMFPVQWMYWWCVENMAELGCWFRSVALLINPNLCAMASLNKNNRWSHVDLSAKASKLITSVSISIKMGPRTGSELRVMGRAKGSEGTGIKLMP